MGKRNLSPDPMETQSSNEMNEFEIKRLQNIQRNQEILRQLAGESLLGIPQSEKSSKPAKSSGKSVIRSRNKQNILVKQEPQRRSLRISGIESEQNSEEKDLGSSFSTTYFQKNLRQGNLPLDLLDSEGKQNFISGIKTAAEWTLPEGKPKNHIDSMKVKEDSKELARELASLKISYSEHAVKVVKERILSSCFHPSPSQLIFTVGDKVGHLGFWHASGFQNETQMEDHQVYAFKPHDGGISTLKYHPLDSTKLFSASYDGSIRMMDVNLEKFEEVILF